MGCGSTRRPRIWLSPRWTRRASLSLQGAWGRGDFRRCTAMWFGVGTRREADMRLGSLCTHPTSCLVSPSEKPSNGYQHKVQSDPSPVVSRRLVDRRNHFHQPPVAPATTVPRSRDQTGASVGTMLSFDLWDRVALARQVPPVVHVLDGGRYQTPDCPRRKC